MPRDPDIQSWLLEQFTTRLTSAFEGMTMERLAIDCQASADPPSGGLTWRQPFAGVAGTMWFAALETDVTAIGSHILSAAGLTDADINSETVKSTYLEVLGQIAAGLAQAISGKLGHEVTPQGGAEALEIPGSIQWSRAEVPLPRGGAVIHIGYDDALLDTPALPELPELEANSTTFPAPLTSKTFDLLLDVELPVSISFGRAQVQLKDVLKLTTGSIVELNRAISEPVEVVVNNCVIARGEVVVVEGNFGVRIQQVISRQERLRTLH